MKVARFWVRWQAKLRSGESLGQYSYGDRDQIREELISEHHDQSGQLVAAVTRNRYGALVLNTANVLFADVDLPDKVIYYREPGWFGRLVSRLSGARPEDLTTPMVWQKARKELRARFVQFQQSHPTLCVQVYETAAGFRLAISNEVYEPDSDDAKRYLSELGSDALYQRLCQNQSCFRARLTPKPWRCGMRKPDSQYPRDHAAQTKFEDWLARYESASDQFSVCRQVDSLGGVANHPVVSPVLELHDRYCVKPGNEKLA